MILIFFNTEWSNNSCLTSQIVLWFITIRNMISDYSATTTGIWGIKKNYIEVTRYVKISYRILCSNSIWYDHQSSRPRLSKFMNLFFSNQENQTRKNKLNWSKHQTKLVWEMNWVKKKKREINWIKRNIIECSELNFTESLSQYTNRKHNTSIFFPTKVIYVN